VFLRDSRCVSSILIWMDRFPMSGFTDSSIHRTAVGFGGTRHLRSRCSPPLAIIAFYSGALQPPNPARLPRHFSPAHLVVRQLRGSGCGIESLRHSRRRRVISSPPVLRGFIGDWERAALPPAHGGIHAFTSKRAVPITAARHRRSALFKVPGAHGTGSSHSGAWRVQPSHLRVHQVRPCSGHATTLKFSK
jgi:hypothetical protein